MGDEMCAKMSNVSDELKIEGEVDNEKEQCKILREIGREGGAKASNIFEDVPIPGERLR